MTTLFRYLFAGRNLSFCLCHHLSRYRTLSLSKLQLAGWTAAISGSRRPGVCIRRKLPRGPDDEKSAKEVAQSLLLSDKDLLENLTPMIVDTARA